MDRAERLKPLEDFDPCVRVARINWGDVTLGEIHALRLLESNDSMSPELQQELMEFCVQKDYLNINELDAFIIAKICVMMTAKDPHKAYEWLALFIEDGLKLADQKEHALNPNFHFGLALGIFHAGVWLDQEWHDSSLNFYKVLPDLVAKLILHSCPAMQWPEIKGESQIKAAKRFDSELNRAIKTYFRPDDDDKTSYLGTRLADINMIQQEMAVFHDQAKKPNTAQEADGNDASKILELTPLGEMVLRQINFTLAGRMNPLSHAIALAQYAG